MGDQEASGGSIDFPSFADSIFAILRQDPKIGLLAVAFAFVIFFAIFLVPRGRSGKLFVGAIVTVCLFIVAVGAYSVLLERAINGSGYLTVKLTSPLGVPVVIAKSSTDKVFFRDASVQGNFNVYDYELLFEGHPSTIFLSVVGRKQISCGPTGEEDIPPAGSSAAAAKSESKFTIILRKAYRSKKFNLEIEYIDDADYGPSRNRADRLVFTNWDGMDKDQIEVLATHTENCVDPQLSYHDFVSTGANPTYAEAVDFSLIASAFAQSAEPETIDPVIKLLSLPGEQNYRALDSFFASADNKTEEIALSIIVGSQYGKRTKADLIRVLARLPVDARPNSDAFIDAVVPLVVDEDYDLRRAALEYLRMSDFVDDRIAEKAHDFLNTELAELTERRIAGREYSAAYIGAVAVRDIFYNLGVRQITEFRQESQSSSPADARQLLDNAITNFEKGYGLRTSFDKREGNRILFEKMTYGKAIAAYAGATSSDAFAQTSSPAEIPMKIIELAKMGQLVPLQQEFAGKAIDWFKAFLANVAGNEQEYAWPHHVVQAKQCTSNPDGLPYGCMNLEPSS